ncbi:Casein kinase II regulatory subunit alpha-helical [Penicillium concentricum]|uniref:Casein kinase II subunit beta n=1 Tax=Penicillium concentricum TaxID=293559 RepID=A0A9W9SS42_9EURO|nr:Casein kinase II regulatory subunit alpha-helical [Penicillium concentricum]KAJ5383115.1 Casein kinase II regulatory subunit alpha-helical [Penicillium concentricum]
MRLGSLTALRWSLVAAAIKLNVTLVVPDDLDTGHAWLVVPGDLDTRTVVRCLPRHKYKNPLFLLLSDLFSSLLSTASSAALVSLLVSILFLTMANLLRNWALNGMIACVHLSIMLLLLRSTIEARDGNMRNAVVDTFVAICFYEFYLMLLRIHFMTNLNLSLLGLNHPYDPRDPRDPPSSGSNPSGIGNHSSNTSRRGPGNAGSSTSRSPDSYSSNSTRYRRAIFIMVVLIAIIYFQFVSSRGNEYFCEIDEDYLTDRFNLTGLNTEVSYYQYALDLVTDVFDLDADDDLREQIEKSARHLYGLVHARYIVTTRGLAKMLEKYKKSDFGKCPRVMCDGHALLPLGESDLPNISTVKLYCPKCEDIYNPKSSRHSSIDGAYFGTSFHSILFQVYPALNPEKSSRRYEPRIYGFKVHAAAALARYQDNQREDLKWRLAEVDINHRFIEDSESDDDAFEYEEEYAEGTPAKEKVGDATRVA